MNTISDIVSELANAVNHKVDEAAKELLKITGMKMSKVAKEDVKYIKKYLKRKKYVIEYDNIHTQIVLTLKQKDEVIAVKIIRTPTFKGEYK